jgi:ribosomal protein S27AE
MNMLTAKQYHEQWLARIENEQCVECGTGLFLREHVENPKRRIILEPMFENNCAGMCKKCYDAQWLFSDYQDETAAAL